MAYPTQSPLFVATSTQNAKRTASLSGFWTTNGNKSVEAWVKFTTLPASGAIMSLCDFGDDGTNNAEFGLKVKNVAGTYVGVQDVYNRNVTGTVSLGFTTGTWYHYAATYDGTNMNWYVDGVLIDSAAAGTITTPASPIVGIGSRTINDAYGEWANARLSLVRFWKEARSAANLAANKCVVLGSTTNLAAEYKLDGNYTDNSGNSNDLTVSVSNPAFAADVPSTCTPVSGFSSMLLKGV